MKLHQIFFILLLCLGISLYIGSIKIALIFATIKALLVGYYFMELIAAHLIWRIAFTSIISIAGMTLFLITK